MGTLKTQDAAFNIGVNVEIKGIDKNTGEVKIQRRGHNRALRYQLVGISKFLQGAFNESNPFATYKNWIPRYLALGTNTASYGEETNVTTVVDINDTRLLDEISPRIALPENNLVINNSRQSFVQLVINTYVPSTLFNGITIREAGLFSNASGNNCLFRIAFDGIDKTEDLILEVNWVISIISIDSGNQPYVGVDKTDLRNAIHQILRRFGTVAPDINTFCLHLINAVEEYADPASTQQTVDTQKNIISADIVAMQDWDVIGVTQEMLDKVDEINGEVIE